MTGASQGRLRGHRGTSRGVRLVGDYLVWLQAGGRGTGTVRIRPRHLYDLSEHVADPWAVTVDDLAAWLSRADH
jgi:hypothetical protein